MKKAPRFIAKNNLLDWVSDDGGESYNRCVSFVGSLRFTSLTCHPRSTFGLTSVGPLCDSRWSAFSLILLLLRRNRQPRVLVSYSALYVASRLMLLPAVDPTRTVSTLTISIRPVASSTSGGCFHSSVRMIKLTLSCHRWGDGARFVDFGDALG